jgi:methylamine utilization protein MauE
MTPVAAWVAALCRLYILVALAAAVAGKAADLRFFRETLAEMFRLGGRAAGAAALALVGAEAAIAFALLAAPRPGMMAALALFASFWLVILVALARRRPLVCNCFGGRARPISGLDLVRNGALVAACACFLLVPPAAALAPASWLLLAALALILFLVSTGLDEIAWLAR